MTLLAAYNFDEASGSVLDVTGNGHGFTLAGVTSRTASGAGHTDKGLTQTGAENAVTVAPFGQTALRTLSAWVKITASVTDGRIFEQAGAGESTWEFLIRVDTIHLQAWNASTFGRASMARPTDNLWHHWAGTYDGTNLLIYLDGVLQATTPFAGPLRTNATIINVFNNIGSAVVIDDVRMHDAALDAATITTLMGTPVTAATGVTGTIAGTLPAVTAAASGTVKVSGAGAGTLPAVTAAGAATVKISGTAAGDLPALTGAATATVKASATIDAALPALTGAITGTATVAGSAAATLPALTGALTGDVASPATPVTGTISASLPAIQGSLTGAVAVAHYTPAEIPVAETRRTDGRATTRRLAVTAVTRDLDGAAITREDE